MAEAARAGFFLLDVNVLVALTNPSHQHHQQAHRWLSGATRFATTPITESGLVRMLLNRAVTGQRVTGRQAIEILGRLRSDERAVFVPDSSSLADAKVDLIGLAGHKQTTDFHLVNLAAERGGVLATFDRRIPQMLAELDQQLVHIIS